jgi:hypothetical protein
MGTPLDRAAQLERAEIGLADVRTPGLNMPGIASRLGTRENVLCEQVIRVCVTR